MVNLYLIGVNFQKIIKENCAAKHSQKKRKHFAYDNWFMSCIYFQNSIFWDNFFLVKSNNLFVVFVFELHTPNVYQIACRWHLFQAIQNLTFLFERPAGTLIISLF